MAHDDGPAAGAYSGHGAVPSGRRPAMSLATTVLMSVLLPYASYRLLVDYDFDTVDALVLAAVFPVGLGTVEVVLRRRIDPLTALSVMVIVLGVAACQLTLDPRLALARYSLFSGALAVVLLGSLVARRPLAFVLWRAVAARRDPVAERVWLDRWRTCPTLRATLRGITAAWAVLLLADAVGRVVAAYTLPVTRATTVNHLASALALVLLVAAPLGVLGWALPAIRRELADHEPG
jgi:hypothetical protein